MKQYKLLESYLEESHHTFKCIKSRDIAIGIEKEPKWESDPNKTIKPEKPKINKSAETKVGGDMVPSDVAKQGIPAVKAYQHRERRKGRLRGGKGKA